jgi:hypothetical protein
MALKERLPICILLMGAAVGLGAVPAAAAGAKTEGSKPTDGPIAQPVNFANPDQLLERRRRSEQPCDWESYEGGQVIRCEAAVDGAVQLVVKATGRIYDFLKNTDPPARKALDASAAAWWKYFKQCDLFALDHAAIAKNGQLAHHGAAGRCRYRILADRLRELLEFEELVRENRRNGSAKK